VEIIFNYLGQLDQVIEEGSIFRAAKESAGPLRSLQSNRHYLLEISGSVIGGQLQFEFRYSRNIHYRSSIEQFAELYVQSLRSIISPDKASEAGWFVPSDFPAAKINQNELDEFIAEITELTARRAE
jgi:non-ribosomal peptide synthase protein (TIGR01720 family)